LALPPPLLPGCMSWPSSPGPPEWPWPESAADKPWLTFCTLTSATEISRPPIAGRARVARELQVLLQHLIGVAADPDIGSRTVIGLALAGHSAMAMTTAM